MLVSGVKRIDSPWISFQQTYQSFGVFAQELNDFQVVDKKDNLPLFCFAEYPDIGVRRRKDQVLRVHAAMFDFDGVDLDALRPTLQVLSEFGYALYTTFSHRGDTRKARFRVITKLSRPVEGREWPLFWLKLVHMLGVEDLVDHKCKDATHIYYPPAGPDKSKFHFEWSDGPGLPVGEILDFELPEKAKRHIPHEEEQEEVPEELRAEITDHHRLIWSAMLDKLEWEILTRPFDSPMRDLRNGQVWYLARQCPHIGNAATLEKRAKRAFDKRYDKYAHDPRSEEWRALAHKEIEVAVEDGQRYPWWPVKHQDKQALPLTMRGLAMRVEAKYGNKIRWLSDRQTWCVYNGRFWEPCGQENVIHLVYDVVQELRDEARVFFAELYDLEQVVSSFKKDDGLSSEEKKNIELRLDYLKTEVGRILKFQTLCENRSLAVVLSALSSSPNIQTTFSRFDSKTNLLNFRNGTLNIETGILHSHRPDDLLTQIVDRDYNAAAICPTFDRFMDDFTQGDEEKKRFLLRMVGYSLLGRTSEQCFVLLYGDGEDGKSTFLKSIYNILGTTYSHKINANYLLEQNSESHPTWLMSLHGKRFAWAEEPSHRKPFNESLMKDITGGAPITARKMRENESSFNPRFTLFIAANHKPSIQGTDHGIWRRVRLVHCNARFTNPDKEMDKKILAEAEGVLALLVREARAYLLSPKIRVPACVTEGVKEYEREEDPLEFFYEHECVLESEPDTHSALLHPPPFRVERKVLWEAYARWLQSRSAMERVPRKKKAFFDTVARRFGAPTKTGGLYHFKGLRPLVPEEKAKRQQTRATMLSSVAMLH